MMNTSVIQLSRSHQPWFDQITRDEDVSRAGLKPAAFYRSPTRDHMVSCFPLSSHSFPDISHLDANAPFLCTYAASPRLNASVFPADCTFILAVYLTHSPWRQWDVFGWLRWWMWPGWLLTRSPTQYMNLLLFSNESQSMRPFNEVTLQVGEHKGLGWWSHHHHQE